MKAICLILSLYTLLLAAFPCCSIDDCDNEILTEQSGASHNEHNSENPDNYCSSFFACGSCPGFIFDFQGINIGPELTNKTKQNILLNPGLQNSYINEFWQPPKTS